MILSFRKTDMLHNIKGENKPVLAFQQKNQIRLGITWLPYFQEKQYQVIQRQKLEQHYLE